MKLNKYSKKTVPCFIQFDGCEADCVDRQEQFDALHAAIICREPCTTWDASDMQPSKGRYEPGNDMSREVLKYIAKKGVSARAKLLAEQQETCRLDAQADELPMEFNIDKNWDGSPFLSIDGVVEIYPEFIGVAFGRSPRFSYSVICAGSGALISEHSSTSEAIVAAAIEAFTFRARTSFGLVKNWSEVPEIAGF
jgi:hypothetical protein